MSDVKNLSDMVCNEINFLRQSYNNPTTFIRKCSHLHRKAKLKDMWAIECQPQPLTGSTHGEYRCAALRKAYL